MQVIAVTVWESGTDSEAAAYDIIQLLGFNCGFLRLRFAAQPLKTSKDFPEFLEERFLDNWR